MLRNQLAKQGLGSDPYFHWRGGDVSRLEGFSDAVFGFAITLLVVSQEVPKTFAQLVLAMRGFPAFGVCFYVLYMIWERHYTFFRRYGLQNITTLALNGVLLFVLLLYIYPLKFVFTVLTNVVFNLASHSAPAPAATIDAANLPYLFVIYGLGFAIVFAIFGLLYLHAYASRDELALTDYERHVTRAEIVRNALTACVGIVSVVIACRLEPRLAGFAGFAFFLISGVEAMHGARVGRAQRSMRQHNLTDGEPAGSEGSAERPEVRPDYGVDAPGVVRNLAMAGTGCIAAALIARLALYALSPALAVGLCWSFGCAGASLLGTAGVMLYGSRVGKLKERERVLDRLAWRGNERVLDVGCGRGLMLNAAARRLTTGAGIGADIWQTEDQSGNSRETTLRNARAEGVSDRLRVLDGDARRLPFADGSFDIVVSSWALHNIYDTAGRATAIREIARVLKPGGHVAIVDIRHAAEYAAALRDAGLRPVRVSRPSFTFLIPSRCVSAAKPANAVPIANAEDL